MSTQSWSFLAWNDPGPTVVHYLKLDYQSDYHHDCNCFITIEHQRNIKEKTEVISLQIEHHRTLRKNKNLPATIAVTWKLTSLY